jgi:polysaccharide biosynthesis protein PslH
MNTLVVAPFLPYPLIFGGAIRLYHMIRMLSEFSEVTLLSYRSSDDEDAPRHLEAFCRRVVISDTKPPSSTLRRARSLVSRHSYQVLSHRSADMQRTLDALVAEDHYDLILVELTPMGAFRLPPQVLKILDMQNIEHELVQRRAEVADSTMRRALLGLEARKVRHEEIRICSTFDLILTTSDRETEIIRSWGMPHVETMVNTIDTAYFTPPEEQRDAPARLAFVGTTHVDANRDGLVYFMREVFPLIREQVPGLEFDIVGGSPPPDIRAFGEIPGVTVTGFVSDVRDYMVHAAALVVPLRSGGGTRLKILEGLSFGVPTISTSVGAEGLGLVDGEHILLGDDPRSFADAVISVLGDPDLRHRLRTAGRRFVEQHYDWKTQAGRMRSVIEAALAGPRPATPEAGATDGLERDAS